MHTSDKQTVKTVLRDPKIHRWSQGHCDCISILKLFPDYILHYIYQIVQLAGMALVTPATCFSPGL